MTTPTNPHTPTPAMAQGALWRHELLHLVNLHYPGVVTVTFTGLVTMLEPCHT